MHIPADPFFSRRLGAWVITRYPDAMTVRADPPDHGRLGSAVHRPDPRVGADLGWPAALRSEQPALRLGQARLNSAERCHETEHLCREF